MECVAAFKVATSWENGGIQCCKRAGQMGGGGIGHGVATVFFASEASNFG